MLNPEKLGEAILGYTENDEAEYAVVINGQWGSGKTYFIKEKLIPELKRKEKKVIYISLYGIGSIDEIKQKVLYELMNFSQETNIKKSDLSALFSETIKSIDALSKNMDLGKTNFAPFANLLLGFSNHVFFKEILIKNKDKYVFYFDDLERIDSKITIGSVLGHINQYVEHHQIKTIIVCNEEKIADSDQYSDWKEKLVWYTYNLTPTISEIIDHFIANYHETKHIINQNKESILKIITISKLENLRTLKVCLQISRRIIKTVEKIEPEFEFYNKLIDFIFIVAIELKNHKLSSENLRTLEQWVYEGYDSSPYVPPANNKKDSSPSYLTEFIKKFYGDSIYARYQFTSRAIFNYITAGYLDEEALKSDIQKLTDSERNPKSIFFQNTWALDNEDFVQIAQEHLSNMEAGNINSPSEVLSQLQSFLYFESKNILPQSKAEIISLFETGITKIRSAKTLEYQDLQYVGTNHIFDEREPHKSDPDYQKVKQLIVDLNNEAKDRYYAQIATDFLQLLPKKCHQFIKDILYISEKYDIFLFAHIDIIQFEAKIWELSNSDLFDLSLRFHQGKIYERTFGRNKKELPNLQQLKNILETKIIKANQNDCLTIQERIMSDILQEIDQAIQELKS